MYRFLFDTWLGNARGAPNEKEATVSKFDV